MVLILEIDEKYRDQLTIWHGRDYIMRMTEAVDELVKRALPGTPPSNITVRLGQLADTFKANIGISDSSIVIDVEALSGFEEGFSPLMLVYGYLLLQLRNSSIKPTAIRDDKLVVRSLRGVEESCRLIHCDVPHEVVTGVVIPSLVLLRGVSVSLPAKGLEISVYMGERRGTVVLDDVTRLFLDLLQLDTARWLWVKCLEQPLVEKRVCTLFKLIADYEGPLNIGFYFRLPLFAKELPPEDRQKFELVARVLEELAGIRRG